MASARPSSFILDTTLAGSVSVNAGVTCDTTFRMSLASPALFNPWRASFSVLGYTGFNPSPPRISNWVRSSTSGWAMLHLPLYNLGLP